MERLAATLEVVDGEPGVPERDALGPVHIVAVAVGAAVDDRLKLSFEDVTGVLGKGIGRKVAGDSAHGWVGVWVLVGLGWLAWVRFFLLTSGLTI